MGIKTINYYRSEGNYGWSRTEQYDEEYGTPKKTPRTDYRLALLKEDTSNGFVERWQALAELRKPIWGENGDKTFAQLLPEMKALPSATIYVPEYLWEEYDVDAGQIPTEVGAIYELGLQMDANSWRIITVPFDGTLTVFDILKQYGMFTHFRKKNINGLPVIIPNPEYAPAVAVREQEIAQVKALLQETMVLTATHVFPALPLNDILSANLVDKYHLSSVDEIDPKWLWKWREMVDGVYVDMPVDPSHPLAVPGPNGGWKTMRRPLRPSPANLELSYWEHCINQAFDYKNNVYTPDQKVKRILGLSV